MLKDIILHPIYDSSDSNIIDDLIIPLLENSQEYLRGVGFFTSSWLALAAKGLAKLIENGGSGRIVLSPMLDEKDWEALQAGFLAKSDHQLRMTLERNLSDLEKSLQQDTLNALAWMVSDGVLEFKFAISRINCHSDYHDKVGVFIDKNDDVVAIHGSFNDSYKATLNGEAFSVFKSWEMGQKPYVEQHYLRLKTLLDKGNHQFQSVEIPQAIREKLISFKTEPRPYCLPRARMPYREDLPRVPFELFPYQIEAIKEWEKNSRRGILEMATGTGKTITSLAAAVSFFQTKKRVALLIVVPYLHLIDQWQQWCRAFTISPLLCSSEHPGWQQKARSKIQDFRIGSISSLSFIAVHQTASSEDFSRIFGDIPADSFMIIADEVHHLGSEKLQSTLLDNASARLGLSATPYRWFDSDGTSELLRYFERISFEYPLELAIEKGFLTPYEYFPEIVHLTADEELKFADLTQKIQAASRRAHSDSSRDQLEKLKILLLERARVINQAENKQTKLLEILSREMKQLEINGEVFHRTLIYVPPGNLMDILFNVSQLGLKCSRFDYKTPYDSRKEILNNFQDGKIQVLIAMKCLDEGVDIPSTERAVFFSSSTNPKEFIQRRGRILRKAPNKKKAILFDLLVLPPIESENIGSSCASLLKREIARFAEFARGALNEFAAREIVVPTLNHFGALDLLDKNPWEIYQEYYSKENNFIEESVNE